MSRPCSHGVAGTGKATLTGSTPKVVRIDLLDDAKRPVGELEVEVDPNGADFRPTTKGVGQACMMSCTLACLIGHGSLASGWHVSRLRMLPQCVHIFGRA